MKRFSLILSIALMFLGLQAQNAGDFDPSFGTNGMTITSLGIDYNMSHDMVIQPDGKIILAGQARVGAAYKFALARYTTDGVLDATFGQDGYVTTSNGVSDFGMSVALQTDGRIVLSGYSYDGSSYFATVVRYNNNGTIDNTFGNNGIAQLPTLNNTETVVIQNDGKIVVAGFSNDNFALARLNSNGSIDTSYGEDGYVITYIQDGSGLTCLSYIKEIALQDDGKIVAAGFLYNSATYNDAAAARYTANGQLDTSFGDGGIFIANLGGLADFSTSLDIQDDGRIILGGHKELGVIVGIPEYDAAVIRLNTDGTYDGTFGTDGVGYFHFSDHATYVDDIVVQADGNILFTGQVVNYTAGDFDIYVCRIKKNGTLDLSFGEDGCKYIDPFGTDDESKSLVMQEDGKILVGGYTNPIVGGPWNFMVIRLLGDDTPTEVPAVEVTFDNIENTSLDVTLTPNALCESFYFVIMTPAAMQQWVPMFGSEAGVIKTFGIHEFAALTHHFTQLNPSTDYYVYTVSVGYDGFEAPFDSAYVRTLAGGGTGEALATIDLSEITETSVRMIVTPNSETAEFHDGLITKAYFDEIGEAAAVEYFQNDGYPNFQTDNWVWIDLESNTIYKAIATCKNALGEWGTPTIVEFLTVITSVNNVETNPLIIFPNPGQGKFEIAGEDIQGGNIKIIDMNGKEVYTAKISSKLTPIDISQCNSGLYIIEIEKDGKVSSSKFLKQ